MPSRANRSFTFLTRSGRARALPTSDFLASSMTWRSVPTEMSDRVVSTRTDRGSMPGAGTSARGKGVERRPAAHLVVRFVEPVRRHARDARYVMQPIRCLEEEDAARLQHAGDL